MGAEEDRSEELEALFGLVWFLVKIHCVAFILIHVVSPRFNIVVQIAMEYCGVGSISDIMTICDRVKLSCPRHFSRCL